MFYAVWYVVCSTVMAGYEFSSSRRLYAAAPQVICRQNIEFAVPNNDKGAKDLLKYLKKNPPAGAVIETMEPVRIDRYSVAKATVGVALNGTLLLLFPEEVALYAPDKNIDPSTFTVTFMNVTQDNIVIK